MTCVQCRWDVDCLQQQSVFQNLASFFDIRAALRLSFVCKQWSEWLTIGSRAANEVWKYWAAETQSILSNFERGKLWQHIVLSEHPSRSKEAYFSMRASVKKARENFVKRQEVKGGTSFLQMTTDVGFGYNALIFALWRCCRYRAQVGALPQ